MSRGGGRRSGDSPNGSPRRPTGAEGGRPGPSIMRGGEGAPPLTGDGPYKSPAQTKPAQSETIPNQPCAKLRPSVTAARSDKLISLLYYSLSEGFFLNLRKISNVST